MKVLLNIVLVFIVLSIVSISVVALVPAPPPAPGSENTQNAKVVQSTATGTARHSISKPGNTALPVQTTANVDALTKSATKTPVTSQPSINAPAFPRVSKPASVGSNIVITPSSSSSDPARSNQVNVQRSVQNSAVPNVGSDRQVSQSIESNPTLLPIYILLLLNLSATLFLIYHHFKKPGNVHPDLKKYVHEKIVTDHVEDIKADLEKAGWPSHHVDKAIDQAKDRFGF